MNKKVYLQTFGCQMNERDSEIIKGLLIDKGFQITDSSKDADAILFNTCSVRKHAEDRVWSVIGQMKKIDTRQKKEKIIGLLGCMAENYGSDAFKRAKDIDLVVGPNNIDAIPLLIKEALTSSNQKPVTRNQFLAVGKRERDEFVYKTGFREEKNHAYVVISEGCNNFCSYCVVPYVRGILRNRHHESILEEIKLNIKKGINCITLLGQNVNAYCSDTKNFDFAKLLESANEFEGLKELTFVTSHPKDASTKLFEAMASLKKIKKYLHLPVQSGSNRILEMMQRGYTREHYLKLVAEFRKILPDGYISTDIIVGFPTETENDFNDTLDLIKRVKFNGAYIFKYSSRPHTRAEGFTDDVPRVEKERRHKIILDLQREISKKKC